MKILSRVGVGAVLGLPEEVDLLVFGDNGDHKFKHSLKRPGRLWEDNNEVRSISSLYPHTLISPHRGISH